MDPIMPLTAGVLCVEGELPPDESLALTAAALVIPGPLALAPALIAVERQRQAKNRGGADVAVPPKAEQPSPKAEAPKAEQPPPKLEKVVGPALVAIPDVVGKTEEEARKVLEDVKFKVDVSYNKSDLAKNNQVLVQKPAASAIPVPEGSLIELQVGKMPEAPALSEDQKAIAALRADLDAKNADLNGKLDRLYHAIETMNGKVEQAKAAAEAAAAAKAKGA